jgi:hypothetical protein
MSPADDGHTPDQRGILLDGILFLVSLLLMLQLWLLTGTMEAFLGGDLEIAWPAALASLACQALNLGLWRVLCALDPR